MLSIFFKMFILFSNGGYNYSKNHTLLLIDFSFIDTYKKKH